MVCRTLCQKSYHKKKKAGGADQGVDREFKPYYHQKKKEISHWTNFNCINRVLLYWKLAASKRVACWILHYETDLQEKLTLFSFPPQTLLHFHRHPGIDAWACCQQCFLSVEKSANVCVIIILCSLENILHSYFLGGVAS
jgi:hypothetical protein